MINEFWSLVVGWNDARKKKRIDSIRWKTKYTLDEMYKEYHELVNEYNNTASRSTLDKIEELEQEIIEVRNKSIYLMSKEDYTIKI